MLKITTEKMVSRQKMVKLYIDDKCRVLISDIFTNGLKDKLASHKF